MSASTVISRSEAQIRAQEFLNAVVLRLFRRTTLPIDQRVAEVGTMKIIDRPADADLVFRQHEVFQKNFGLVAAIGESRFNLNGDRWQTFRARTQPRYSRAGRPASRDKISSVYRTELEAIERPDFASIEHAFGIAALRVFFDALGLKPDPEPFLELFEHLRRVAARLQAETWTGGTRLEISRQDAFDEAADVAQIFWDLCQSDPETVEFLANSVEGEDPSEFRHSVTDLMQNMFAGIETSIATLCWAVSMLGHNADAQKRIHDEVMRGGTELKYTQTFIYETMRCFPPIPFVIRECVEDTEVGSVKLKAGDQVMVSIVGIHRHPDGWENPNEFHSAREEFLESDTPPAAFKPFLSGPRVCGGRRLAELELIEAFKLFVELFDVSNPHPQTDFNYALAFRPELSPDVKIVRRQG